MRSQRILRAAALVWIAVMMGCARHPEPEFTPSPGVYAAPDKLKFSVKVTPTRFTPGEPVSLEASLFNGGDQAFEKTFMTGCQWDFEIAADNGRVLGPSRVCTMAGSELRLEPGELRMIIRDWKGNDDYFGVSEPLTPGRYAVTAGFVDADTRVVPMAEPFWIEVVASGKKR
jgi:Intracellular proteinase inhibitor